MGDDQTYLLVQRRCSEAKNLLAQRRCSEAYKVGTAKPEDIARAYSSSMHSS